MRAPRTRAAGRGLLDAGFVDAGFVDAGAADAGATDAGLGGGPGPGDLVIVEIQGNPQGVADANAEYIELLNVSGRTLDLFGVQLAHRDYDGVTPPVASVGLHTIDESVSVAPGARILLTRSTGGYFGGALVDYVYDGFDFSNGDDRANRLRLLTSAWDGSEPPDPAHLIDEVTAPIATFDNLVRGQSWQLDPSAVSSPDATSNDAAASWCRSNAAGINYWGSNWGTPGAANACP